VNPTDQFATAFIRGIPHEHQTVPQKQLNNRTVTWPTGKGLGGSSAVNFAAFTYCTKADHDWWLEITGDEVWKWEAVQERYKQVCVSLFY
jgi:choline dehydrogenase-like flavoprotein